MKKGQIYAGTVEKVAFPNKGIVRTEDGKIAVVKNVTPGQKISFSVNKVRKGKGEGRLLEVLEKSPLELESAPCEHFGICGGCTFLNLDYETQLKLKEQQVKELLKPVCISMGRETAVCLWKRNLRESEEAPISLAIGTRWNFPLETAARTVRYHWECIKEEAFMML